MKDFLINYLKNQPEKLAQVNSTLSDSLQKSNDGIELGEKIQHLLQLQYKDKVYDFEMSITEGQKVRLSDFRGKKLMIEFWASCCVPFPENLPILKKFAEANPAIVILAISLDQDQEKWLFAIKKYQFDLAIHLSELQGFDGEVFVTLFQVNSIPRAIMQNEQGRVVNLNFNIPR